MQVDFYQLSRDPVERVVPLLAAKALAAGTRVVIISGDPAQRSTLSDALWAREGEFLAHGETGAPYAERQPIVLAADCAAANGAAMAIVADGEWRAEAVAAGFERAILLFGPDQRDDARRQWSALAGGGHDLRIFKQSEGGGWREGR